jgi:hypothetical protein
MICETGEVRAAALCLAIKRLGGLAGPSRAEHSHICGLVVSGLPPHFAIASVYRSRQLVVG